MELRRFDLRYVVTSIVLDAGRPLATATLRQRLEASGVDLGPDPRRRLYGALRSEVRVGRLRRVEDGVYGIDHIPPSTRSHIRRHATAVHEAIAAGHPHPPRRRRYEPQPPVADIGRWGGIRSLEDLQLPPVRQPVRDAHDPLPPPADR